MSKQKMHCLVVFLSLTAAALGVPINPVIIVSQKVQDVSGTMMNPQAVLDEFASVQEKEKISKPKSLCSLSLIQALHEEINRVTDARLANQPVTQVLRLVVDANRNVNIHRINVGNGIQSNELDWIDIGSGEKNVSGDNRILAYRRDYRDTHDSGMAGLFLNLDELFPCAGPIMPLCSRSTYEEDGFLQGKAILQASDIGNDFTVFGSGIFTFGIAFQGCSVMNGINGCLPSFFATTIVCLLPRSCL